MNKKMKLLLLLLVIISLFFFFNKEKQIKTDFIGAYEYRIINDSLFINSYFNESFGYVISDYNLNDIGIDIFSNEKINKKDEYIFAFNHPIKKIIKIDDGIDYVKKNPIQVYLDTTKSEKKIYVYRLKEVGKYRLLLP